MTPEAGTALDVAPQERRRGLHPDLSQRQGFALLDEAASAQNLLRDAIQAIRGMRYVSTDGDAVFTLGSIGVEKAMKVMLGSAAVANEGAWPQKSLKRAGHNILDLNTQLMAQLENGIGRARSRGFANQLRSRIEGSALLPLIFATFDRYGRSGRFHYLDILANDEPGEHESPSAYWDHVELHVRESRPEFHDVPWGDNAALDDYLQRLRNVIADELNVWWFCVHRLAVLGCFGELGVKSGWEIWEPGRTAPQLES